MITMFENKIDIRLFPEFIDGNLKSTKTEFNTIRKLSNLIKENQTRRIVLADKEIKSFNNKLKPDLRFYGFKSVDDYNIKDKNALPGGSVEFHIIPNKIYTLKEYHEVPKYNSKKLNTFIALILDEYERIKIRAEHKHDLLTSERDLNLYCKKNIQKAKKVFNEALNCMNGATGRRSLEDFYIYFILCQILIKTILFYQKQFFHFINFKLEKEQSLYAKLYTKALNGKLDILFKLALGEFSDSESLFKSSSDGLWKVSNSEIDLNTNSKSNHYNLKQDEKIIWYGQVNALVDAFEQIANAQDADGTRLCVVSLDQLQDLICNNFYDSEGKPIKPNTVKTILNPKRIDKKLNKDSDKRIDMPFDS
jgi:hypothetical protein